MQRQVHSQQLTGVGLPVTLKWQGSLGPRPGAMIAGMGLGINAAPKLGGVEQRHGRPLPPPDGGKHHRAAAGIAPGGPRGREAG